VLNDDWLDRGRKTGGDIALRPKKRFLVSVSVLSKEFAIQKMQLTIE
jgi:hypothetical protein